RPRHPERRHLQHFGGADQRREGAHDHRRRTSRPPAQSLMSATRAARAAGLVAAALALTALYAGLRFGALVAGGADSYGYVSQAGLWRQGLPIVQQDIVRGSPWPFAADTWSPLGYRPSPKQRGAIVPLYAPGLPLLMALFQAAAGYCGAFFVVPLCGALTIWLTYMLGRRLCDESGVSVPVDERHERRTGDRGLDARARPGGEWTSTGERPGDERRDRHSS